jgi:hypothetical protein
MEDTERRFTRRAFLAMLGGVGARLALGRLAATGMQPVLSDPLT